VQEPFSLQFGYNGAGSWQGADVMKMEEARQRIESAIEQYGQHAAAAIELVVNEVRSDHGVSAVNELIEEFDLELLYNIPPQESDYSNS
jgi:hypothetical protein